MIEWDLFVDESGSFDNSDVNIVAGFILPHEVVRAQLASEWYHHVTEHTKKQFIGTPGITDYNFRHYNQNSRLQNRREIQLSILRQYADQIRSVGGELVVMTSEQNHVDVDNTTTYLSIIAKGIIKLYTDLQTKNLGEPVSLRLHIAQRKDLTSKENHPNLSPTAVSNGVDSFTSNKTILPEQYVGVIRHVAYLTTDPILCTDPLFIKMLDEIDILQDRFIKQNNQAKNEQLANYWTAICDPIANTYWSYCIDAQHWINAAALFQNAYIYNTSDPDHAQIDAVATACRSNEYAFIFLKLMRDGFPAQQTTLFFKLFNNAHIFYQNSFLLQIISYFDAAVYYHEYDQFVIQSVKQVLQQSVHIQNSGIRAELNANLYLFLNAMYTHLGKTEDVDFANNQFQKSVVDIPDRTAQNQLYALKLNRDIVMHTDRYQFELAKDAFAKLELFWESIFRASQALHDETTDETSEEYGKAIGSYLQLMPHILRRIPEKKQEEFYQTDIAPYYTLSLKQFSKAEDLHRMYLNFSVIESDIAHFQQAYQYLYTASALALIRENKTPDIGFGEGSSMILEAAGYRGTARPWILIHLLRLIMNMERKAPDSPLCKELFEQISKQLASPDDYEEIRSIHPRTQALWKTAAVFSLYGNWNTGLGYYNRAIEELRQAKAPVFLPILIAVQAERAGFALLNSVNSQKVDSYRIEIQNTYEYFEKQIQHGIVCNPFINNDINLLHRQETADDLFHIANMIAF